ncbi:MAG: hypothetical protein AAGU17_12275 [Anaerolineaceae bacterium]|jgi:hypothetical protein
MKKTIGITLLLIAALLLLSACGPRFTGTETTDATHFALDFTQLDGTKAHEMTMDEGAIVDVVIEPESGRLDILVSGEKGEVIYQANDAESMIFSLIIRKAYTYKFVVIGENAAGAVSFTAYP